MSLLLLDDWQEGMRWWDILEHPLWLSYLQGLVWFGNLSLLSA